MQLRALVTADSDYELEVYLNPASRMKSGSINCG